MAIEVMAKVIESFDLPPREKYITLLYANYANREGEGIWPSQTTMAEMSGYSRTTVNKVTKILSKAEVLIPDGKTEHQTLKWKINTKWDGNKEDIERIITNYNENRGVNTGSHVNPSSQLPVNTGEQPPVNTGSHNTSVETPDKPSVNGEKDLVDAMLRYSKNDEYDVDDYPVDVQSIVEKVAKYWGFTIPGEGSDKAKWIKFARQIRDIIGTHGLELIDTAWDVWMAETKENGEEPYPNVTDIQSIVSWFKVVKRKKEKGMLQDTDNRRAATKVHR